MFLLRRILVKESVAAAKKIGQREGVAATKKFSQRESVTEYLSLPPTRHDLTQGQKPEGRLKWG